MQPLFTIVAILSLACWPSPVSAADGAVYKDPDGWFELTKPQDWKVEREMDEFFIRTTFRAPKGHAMLIVTAGLALDMSDVNEKLRDTVLQEMGAIVLKPWRDLFSDDKLFRVITSGEVKRTKFQGYDALRQDVTFERRKDKVVRTTYAIFFFANNNKAFHLNPTGDQASLKEAEEVLATWKPGPNRESSRAPNPLRNKDGYKKMLDQHNTWRKVRGLPPLPDEREWLPGSMDTLKDLERKIAEWEKRRAQNPNDPKPLELLRLCYRSVWSWHYKRKEEAKADAANERTWAIMVSLALLRLTALDVNRKGPTQSATPLLPPKIVALEKEGAGQKVATFAPLLQAPVSVGEAVECLDAAVEYVLLLDPSRKDERQSMREALQLSQKVFRKVKEQASLNKEQEELVKVLDKVITSLSK